MPNKGKRMSVSALPVAMLLAAVPVAPAIAQASETPAAPAPEKVAPPAPDADANQDELVVTGRPPPPREDPLQAINVQTYQVVQTVDRNVVNPMALGYKHALPEPVRAGVRNFFNNLAEPIVFLNFLIQHKIGKAIETVGRFGLNSTLGGAGLFDVAKRHPFNLPLRRNGFANSMGFYGVKPGPFLFLPLVGPTTVRDLIGLGLDKLVLPVAIGKPFNKPYYTLPSSAISTLDYRVEFDAELRRQQDAPDPYAASRAYYLQSRQAEIDALHVHHRHKDAPVPTPAEAKPSPTPSETSPVVAPSDAPAVDETPPAPATDPNSPPNP